MQIQFCGATGEVTGSCYLFTINGKKVAFEAGMFQGHRLEADAKNHNLLFEPAHLDAVVLSHAHVDHVGLLPSFYAHGFRGKVYCTMATSDLMKEILQDAAFIQEHTAEVWNKRNGDNQILPLYTIDDAQSVMELVHPRNFYDEFDVVEGMKVRFIKAGHILGSAQEEITLTEGGKTVKIYFTADLGRKDLPIIDDPDFVEQADILITESTYGNREHDPFPVAEQEFYDVINDTVKKGGNIIIPSFAMERTQEIVYLLHKGAKHNKIPEIPVYIDSPLATNVTEIFRDHPELFDEATAEDFGEEDPFGFGRLKYTRTAEESKALAHLKMPSIIISASGMCEAGRILHHLENNVSDERNTIMIVGFMAEGTLGRQLVDRLPSVKIFGEEFPLRARVKIFNNFSAHADHNEIMAHVRGVKGIQKVFVVHGEMEAATAMAMQIKTEMNISDVVVPTRGEIFEL